MYSCDSILLEWEMCQEKLVEKIKTHILCLIIFFPRKSYRLLGKLSYGQTGHRRQSNKAHALCMLDI